jgi:hypothetical protein
MPPGGLELIRWDFFELAVFVNNQRFPEAFILFAHFARSGKPAVNGACSESFSSRVNLRFGELFLM